MSSSDSGTKQQAFTVLIPPEEVDKSVMGPWSIKESNALFTQLEKIDLSEAPIQLDMLCVFIFGAPKDMDIQKRDLAAIWVDCETIEAHHYRVGTEEFQASDIKFVTDIISNPMKKQICRCNIARNVDRKAAEEFVSQQLKNGAAVYGKWSVSCHDAVALGGVIAHCGLCPDHGAVAHMGAVVQCNSSAEKTNMLLKLDIQHSMLKYWSRHIHSGWYSMALSCPGTKGEKILQ